jgi:hypothetical protein
VVRLLIVHSRLDLTARTAYQGPRKLLKEGPVTKLTLVLCNDVLVLIESRNLYRMVSDPRVDRLDELRRHLN